jgi:hypothetical protein
MNAIRTLFLAPVLALALALAGAGCGNSDENDFIDGYNAATAPLMQLMTDVSGSPTKDSLDQMATGLEDVKKRLAALEPPDDAQDELDGMLAAIDAGAADVRKMAKAAKAGDVDKLTAATQEFSAEGAKLVEAEEALRKAVEG